MSLRKCHVIQSILFVTILQFAGCGTNYDVNANARSSATPTSESQNSPTIDEASIAKVRVLINGKIQLNDKEVTIEELKTALAAMNKATGGVWYYRENPTGEPPPHAMSVINAIIEAELPVKLSTKPDFSDAVGPEKEQIK